MQETYGTRKYWQQMMMIYEVRIDGKAVTGLLGIRQAKNVAAAYCINLFDKDIKQVEIVNIKTGEILCIQRKQKKQEA